MHGGLIITNSKEQSAEMYKHVKSLDTQAQLSVARLGSIAYVAPHIDYLVYALDEQSNEEKRNSVDFDAVSVENTVRCADFSQLDILICTVSQLTEILRRKVSTNPFELNPKYVIINNYDILFENQAKWEALRSILRHFLGSFKSVLKDYNPKRKVLRL